MLWPQSQLRIWLYARPTDLRKSYDGLAALAKNALGENPLSGELFVFVNRKRTQMKVLYFEAGGYCIWSKRLESGQFQYREQAGAKQVLDWSALRWLIEGIDERSVRRYKRYRHRTEQAVPV
jgi:transposase